MEGEAHRDYTERPAWREGPDPVDYVDPPELLHARTIDQLLGPKADYRKARGVLAPEPHRAGCICGLCYDAVGGGMAYGAWVTVRETMVREQRPALRWWQRLFRLVQGATDVEA